MKRVGVTGASGFIGLAVIDALCRRGDYVRALVRDPGHSRLPAGVETRPFDVLHDCPPQSLEDLDAVIHLAGESISGRWTAEKKSLIRQTRTLGTRNLVDAMLQSGRPPRTFVCASASGYYGDRGDEPLDESSAPGDDFLARVCVDWEAEAQRAASIRTRVVCLRQGLVCGGGGGALQAMLPAFKLCAGGPLGSGRQFWPWIHLTDVAALYLHALDHEDIAGPVNAVSPEVATSARFAHALGHALGRPSVMPAPAVALRAVLGEFADSVLASQLMLASKAQDSGFAWHHESLEHALLDIFNPRRRPALAHVESGARVTANQSEVFAFFADARNRAKLIPPRLKYADHTPTGSVLRRGAVTEHELQRGGLKFFWKSLIVRWQPEVGFTDLQLRGPYELWKHQYIFSEEPDGVLIRDVIDYSLPLAPLSNVALPLIRRDLEEIFRYRKTRIAELLSGDGR